MKGKNRSTKIVTDYISLVKSLPVVLESFGIKHNYVYRKARISRDTFYRKYEALRKGEVKFTPDEILRIIEAINN